MLRTLHILLRSMVSLLALSAVGGQAVAEEGLKRQFLELDSVRFVQFSRFADVAGVSVIGDSSYSFEDGVDYFYATPLHPQGLDDPEVGMEDGFLTTPRGIARSQKIPLGDIGGFGRWMGLFNYHDSFKVLFGSRLKLVILEGAQTVISRHDIIVDQVRPAGDGRGVADSREVQRLSSWVDKRFRKVKRKEKVALGVAPLPAGWAVDHEAEFMFSTKLSRLPIVTVGCEVERPGLCYFKRQCFLRGQFEIAPKYRAGIAISEKRRQLVLADRQYNRLFIYDYHSCYDVSLYAITQLPDEIASVRGLYIDDQDRLWVTTEARDMQLNGSVYIWETADW